MGHLSDVRSAMDTLRVAMNDRIELTARLRATKRCASSRVLTIGQITP